MTTIRQFICSICVFFFSTFASAAFLVNTGTPENDSANYTVDTANYVAARFTVTGEWMLQHIEAWVTCHQACEGDGLLMFQIARDDNGGLPGGSNVVTGAIFPSASDAFSWQGRSILAPISDGTYWLSFSSNPYSAIPFSGLIGGLAPDPLQSEMRFEGGTWIASDMGLAIRITAIPLPPAIYLFATGLIGLVGMARCKRKQ